MKVRRSSALLMVLSAFSFLVVNNGLGGGLNAADAQAAPPPAPPAVPNPAAPAAPAPAAPLPPLTPPVTQTGEQAPPLAVGPPPELVPQPVPTLPPGTATPVPAAPITLAQAIAIGLQHQPTVTLAQASVQSAAGRSQQAASALKPSVNVSSSFNHTSTSAPGGFGGSSDSFNDAISARQLVFDFNHTKSSVQAARDQEKAAVASFTTARQNTIFDISQAYYTLLEDEGLISVASTTVDAQRAHLAEARAKYSAGTGAPVDVLMAQTNLADALLTLSTDQNAAAIARTNLDIAMGIDPRTPTHVVQVGPLAATLPDLNSLVTKGLADRPEMAAAKDQVAASEEDLKNARTNNYPAVVASGSLGIRGSSFPGDTTNRSVGLSLQWDVFDSGATSGLIKEAEAALLTSQTNLYQTQQTVSTDVTQAYLNVANAQQRVVTTNAEVANAQETLRLADGQYRVGVGILLAVTDDQAALALAEADQVNAIYALDIELAALNRAVGGGI